MKKFSRLTAVLFLFVSLISCTENSDGGGTYVKPSIDYKGRFRKGHIRMPVSTDKNALKNQNRSKYYYQTRGKHKKNKK